MTLFARRVYYAGATLIFLMITPIVLFTAAGYQWGGVKRGFVRTGVLVIQSQPRTTIYLNNHAQGSTPRRFPDLSPGTYEVRLERPGYTAWKRLIRIEANQAQVLNAIRLFPSTLRSTVVSDVPGAFYLSDQEFEHTYKAVSADGTWIVKEIWPTAGPNISLPEKPEAVTVSPRLQTMAIQVGAQTALVKISRQPSVWLIPKLDHIVWESSTDHAVYGLRGDTIIRFDLLNSTERVITKGSSLLSVGSDLLYTTNDTTTTSVWRLWPYGPVEPTSIGQVEGKWQLSARHGRFLILSAEDSAFFRIYRLDPSLQPIIEPQSGPATFFANTAGTGPLAWSTGVDVVTLNADGNTELLERSPYGMQAFQWLYAPHIALFFDGQAVTIKSVSDKQGRSILLHDELSGPARVVGLSAAKKILLVTLDSAPETVRQLHW